MAAPQLCRGVPRAIRRTRWDGGLSKSTRTTRTIATAAPEHHELEREAYLPDTHTPATLSRRDAVREAKPFSDFLTDTFARQHDYLRISLTERCNLRCLYCMPEEGIQLQPPNTQLTTPEVFYLSQLFVNQGVNKIRLTGGEPTVRKDIVPLMQRLGSLRSAGLKELALTTNGISLWRKLDAMAEAGLTGVNISLDTLDPFQFQLLTRRQGFDAVMKSINRVQEMNKLGAGIKLKINCVVMRGLNDHQILPFVEMTREQDVEVRFIEYMPFGGNKWSENKMLPYQEMLDVIRTKYPDVGRLRDKKNDTSKTWAVPGFAGRVGFITSMTHNFCGSCNRLRITSDGNLKVCLHGETEVSLRDLLRSDHDGMPMDDEAFDAIRQLELDRRKGPPGLRFDGEEGWMTKESQLLKVIGQAVKRKKAKHAGMGQLENMKNRPMILIGERHSGCSQPWSKVPTYLLRGASYGLPSHARAFSTTARRRTDNDDSDAHKDEQKPSFASTFGFQSLSGLFQDAPKPRYSRQKVREEEKVDLSPIAQSREADEHSQAVPDTKTGHKSIKGDYFQAAEVPSKRSLRRGYLSLSEQDRGPHTYPPGESVTRGEPRDGDKRTSWKHVDLRQPNPFKIGGRDVRSFRGKDGDGEGEGADEAAWGVKDPVFDGKREDVKGVVVDAGVVRTTNGTSTSRVPKDSKKGKTAKKAQASAKAQDVGQLDTHTQQTEPKLTHLTSSGEAHMVDVGAKRATRRVAVAIGRVRFRNPAPFQLIFENNNKKGDVLGVARVAGIMASKRTADLIPLCHPVAITKVEVDVALAAPDSTKGINYGLVTVEALVETVGPTGVEMEAMTAVMGATQTVYDMCKAVDKLMVIDNMQVVYKSGGRSGLHLQQWWGKPKGKEWFEKRGLEVSPVMGWGEIKASS